MIDFKMPNGSKVNLIKCEDEHLMWKMEATVALINLWADSHRNPSHEQK